MVGGLASRLVRAQKPRDAMKYVALIAPITKDERAFNFVSERAETMARLDAVIAEVCQNFSLPWWHTSPYVELSVSVRRETINRVVIEVMRNDIADCRHYSFLRGRSRVGRTTFL